MIVPREVAEKALHPYFERLRQCIVAGFDAWQELGKIAPQFRVHMKPRTRAAFVFDMIVKNVYERFAGMKGVRIVDKRGFPELVIDGEYVIRFKKLDSKGRSRNILTKQTRLWLEQQLQLPDMDAESVRLIAGYVLDDLGSAIERVMVTCPKNTTANEWGFELPEDEAATNVVQMPGTGSPNAPAAPPVRSTMKKTKDNPDESA